MGSVPKLSIIKGQPLEFTPRPLHRMFEENLLHHPNQTALIYNENVASAMAQPRQRTYNELNRNANQCARLLATEAKQRFLQPNTDGDFIIAVCMQPSDWLVTTLMAIWKAGAAYLPIDPSFPNNRIQHILQESRPVLVIRDDDIESTRFGNTLTICVSDMVRQLANVEATNLVADDMLTNGRNNPAIILYTSGSTGIPKGVRLPHEVILNRLQWQWSTFPYIPAETVGVFKTALTFVDSVAELWSPLLCGMAVLVVPKVITKDPERLVEILEKFKIRRLVLVPTLLRSLLMYLNLSSSKQQSKEGKLLNHLQLWVCSGEPLPTALAMSFFDYFDEGVHTLCNFYGSTEVMGDVTYFVCESKKQLKEIDRVPIGVPVANTVIYLLDADYRPVKQGEIGEIYVAGLNLANGYVNLRDKDRFVDNPLALELKYSRIYRTGDYGSASNSGYIMYEGRTDSQIKIRGYRVDLSEVEKIVTELPNIEKAIVLCYNVGQVDQALLAFVKLNDGAPLLTEMQVEAQLKDKLADYMSPQVIIIEHVPLLVNGKVDRQTLLKSYETTNNNEGDSSIVLDYDFTGVPEDPQTKVAARDLFETVGSVIGRSTRATLTLKSNFYELGGNSLNSIFTVTLLREKGYNIGISEFIAAKHLGDILEKMTKQTEESAVSDDWLQACPHLNMEAIPLQLRHKNDVIQIIVDSFYGKADLEQWLKPDIYRTDYSDIINDIWDELVEKNLSFIVRDKNTNRIIGTALNFDARAEPEVDVKSKLIIVFEFLEFVEGPIRDNFLPKGLNKILHSFMMGTHIELNAQENIACMHFMEDEVLKVAKTKKFAGIMTTNTSPLTQQLGNDVYHYKTLLDYQVNQYVYSDGSRPFGKAPDSQRAIVHWKEVTP